MYEGHPVAISPTVVPRHQYVASALQSEFHQQLKKGTSCKAFDPIDYKINEDLILIPDIQLFASQLKKNTGLCSCISG